MPDQTPDYVPPPPRGSGTGLIVGIVVGVVLLLLVCGVGLIGVTFLSYRRALDAELQQLPPIEQDFDLPSEPVEEPPTPAPANPAS